MLNKFKELLTELSSLSEDEKIDMLNDFKREMHKVSPMNTEPVDCVIWIKSNQVHANDYNPNSVAAPEMELLKISVLADGYTQPVVTSLDENSQFEVVDGFHRTRICKETPIVSKRVKGRIPIVLIREECTKKEDRIASTIRHNRARGKHQVSAMSDIILDLARRGWNDEKIALNLGMSPDEVLRLKQITGLAELFADKDFSKAWEAVDSLPDNDDLLELEQ